VEGVSKLDHDVVDRLAELRVEEELADQRMLLLDPMRLSERDQRRRLKQRRDARSRIDRNGV
jgi:hypothetical protein